MKVQILQCKTKKWMPVSWLIRVFQKTPYSHYAIGYTSHTGAYMVLDATSKNTAIRSSKIFLSHYKIVNEYTIDLHVKYEFFCKWYEQLLGTGYGYMQLLGILLKNKRLGEGIICNELVLRLINRFTKYSDNDIDIRDLNYTDKVVRELAEK